MNNEINSLLKAESEQLQKLQDIVKKSISDENLIIENLLNPPKDRKFLIKWRDLVAVGPL